MEVGADSRETACLNVLKAYCMYRSTSAYIEQNVNTHEEVALNCTFEVHIHLRSAVFGFGVRVSVRMQ